MLRAAGREPARRHRVIPSPRAATHAYLPITTSSLHLVPSVIFQYAYRPGVIFRRVHGPGVIFGYSPTPGVIFSQKATLCDNF